MYYVYIITNSNNTTLYIGVTNNIVRRVYEHKNKLLEGFSKDYNLNKLVYYELFDDVEQAISREKRLKSWNREWKENLIHKFNLEWKDLYDKISKQ